MTDRDYFYELVDNVPEAKLVELRKALLIMALPEEEVTEEELDEIRIGKEQIANGEFTSYSNFEELQRGFMNE